MEKGKKTFRNSKRDPLDFRVNSKGAFIAKKLFLTGKVNVKTLAKEIIRKFPGSPNPRITEGTIKTFLSDLTLERGTFSPSREIPVIREGDNYSLSPETFRKYRDKYREFYGIREKRKGKKAPSPVSPETPGD